MERELTREQIVLMPDGREMDGLIAERIFGHTELEYVCISPILPNEKELVSIQGGNMKFRVPYYSTEISHAWEIVEKITRSLDKLYTDDGEIYGYWTLDRLGYDCCQDGKLDIDGVHGQWRCRFSMNKSDEERIDNHATADTAALAICRASLLNIISEKK